MLKFLHFIVAVLLQNIAYTVCICTKTLNKGVNSKDFVSETHQSKASFTPYVCKN